MFAMLRGLGVKAQYGPSLLPSLQAISSHIIGLSFGEAWRSFSSVAPSGPSVAVGTQASMSISPSAIDLPEDAFVTMSAHNEPVAEAFSTLAGPPCTPPADPPGLPQLQVPPHVLRDLRPPVHPYQLVPQQAQRITSTPAMYTPWTPTRALQRRAHVSRRMGFLMQVLEREQMERVRSSRPLPDFRAGDVLEVRVMVPEAERRVAVYRGVCIARYHKGLRSTFKIYNVFPECGGVVQHFPLYMPDLLGIKVVGRIPASQERLFYLLERETSDYTFQTGVGAAK